MISSCRRPTQVHPPAPALHSQKRSKKLHSGKFVQPFPSPGSSFQALQRTIPSPLSALTQLSINPWKHAIKAFLQPTLWSPQQTGILHRETRCLGILRLESSNSAATDLQIRHRQLQLEISLPMVSSSSPLSVCLLAYSTSANLTPRAQMFPALTPPASKAPPLAPASAPVLDPAMARARPRCQLCVPFQRWWRKRGRRERSLWCWECGEGKLAQCLPCGFSIERLTVPVKVRTPARRIPVRIPARIRLQCRRRHHRLLRVLMLRSLPRKMVP